MVVWEYTLHYAYQNAVRLIRRKHFVKQNSSKTKLYGNFLFTNRYVNETLTSKFKKAEGLEILKSCKQMHKQEYPLLPNVG